MIIMSKNKFFSKKILLASAWSLVLILSIVFVFAGSGGSDAQSAADNSNAAAAAEKGTENIVIDESLPISYVHATYAFNAADLRQVAGFADTIFAAEVVSVSGGGQGSFIPHTTYTVNVIDVIKGFPVLGKTEIMKAGGLSKSGKNYILYEEDSLPKVGKVYIFFGSYQVDGKLLAAGKNSSLVCDLGKVKTSKDGIEVKKFRKPSPSEIEGVSGSDAEENLPEIITETITVGGTEIPYEKALREAVRNSPQYRIAAYSYENQIVR